jgi:hypothetical protein
VLPAGTRVQAPGTAARPAQTFEVAADSQLRADFDGLTATWVPLAQPPDAREVRFLGDPGFGKGDLVLFVEEKPEGSPCGNPPIISDWDADSWIAYWRWVLCLYGISAKAQALAVASVVSRTEELGTTLVEFDRDLHDVLASATAPYAAYRVQDSAGEARRLSKVLQISGTTVTTTALSGVANAYDIGSAIEGNSIILDAELEGLSQGQTIAVVDWKSSDCDVVAVGAHRPVAWEVAPGTPTRASQVDLVPPAGSSSVGTLGAALGPLTAYVVDRRVLARHYVFPQTPQVATAGQLRLYPKPEVDPERIAVLTTIDGKPTWEVLACRTSSAQETPVAGDPADVPRGLIVDLVEAVPQGTLVKARASANLVLVRHGTTTSAVLGSGDAAKAGQSFTLPDAPIAYDVDDSGSVVPTQDLRVDGVHWDEVTSLYGTGPIEAFTVRLDANGGVAVRFGDGAHGARLPTGRGNVRTTYRVGGGAAGEVEGGAIDSLLGSVRGVKKVLGAGPTSGGADQDDERRLRALVPARARAFGRAISLGDLVDLSLGYPGVTHAAAWNGEGPPGCACGRSGLHLAFVRAATGGPRAPTASEVAALAAFLDASRDTTVALCVCAAVLTDPPVALTAQLAVDPRRLVADVVAAATAAVVDPGGPLAPLQRALGMPLDRSDVVAVLHGVEGVVGVPSLTVAGTAGELGRRPAARYELIVLDPQPSIGGEPA